MTETSHLKVVPFKPRPKTSCTEVPYLKVVPFKPRPKTNKELEDQADATATLKEVLAEAEAGNVNAVSIAIVRPGGGITSTNSGGDLGGLLGALALAQYRLLAGAEDSDDCDDPDDDPDDGGEPAAAALAVNDAA